MTPEIIVALCAAYDGNDERLLLIIADALEEIGDDHHAGFLRWLHGIEREPGFGGRRFQYSVSHVASHYGVRWEDKTYYMEKYEESLKGEVTR